MPPMLFIEAFGTLSEDAVLPVVERQETDLYGMFNQRAESMGWSSTSHQNLPLLWAMHEAELTDDCTGADTSRIGFAQVGLDVGAVEPVEPQASPRTGYSALPFRRRNTEPVRALLPLIQCLTDALSRFGAVELCAIQVTACYLEPSAGHSGLPMVAALDWFDVIPKSRVEAIVSFNRSLVGGLAQSALVGRLQNRNDGPFEFGTLVAIPERHMVKTPDEMPYYPASLQSDVGLPVAMPEWTPSAAGCVLANVVDVACAGDHDINDFAIRITRVR